MEDSTAPKKRRKGIYLLPNLFTTGTLFGGFYAIISSMNGDFGHAAAGVFAAMVADGLDGRIARLTNTQSDFGKEYDSLCDMVAFGIAPAVLMYSFSLQYLSEYRWLGGKLGWVIAFLYCACAALRLARFNVLTAIAGSNKDFFGLPSPSAAALTSFFVWSVYDWPAGAGLGGRDFLLPCAFFSIAAALLMVSSVRYNSFKQIKLSKRGPFIYMVMFIGLLTLILIDPPRVLFVMFFGYAVSGPAVVLWRRWRKAPAPAI